MSAGSQSVVSLDDVNETGNPGDTNSSTTLAAAPACDVAAAESQSQAIAVVTGFVSRVGEGVGRSDNDRQFVFCNNRPVDVPKVSKVINEVSRIVCYLRGL